MLTYLTMECGLFWYPSLNSFIKPSDFHGTKCTSCYVREWCMLYLWFLNKVEQNRNSVSGWHQKKLENVACDCRFLGDNSKESSKLFCLRLLAWSVITGRWGLCLQKKPLGPERYLYIQYTIYVVGFLFSSKWLKLVAGPLLLSDLYSAFRVMNLYQIF